MAKIRPLLNIVKKRKAISALFTHLKVLSEYSCGNEIV